MRRPKARAGGQRDIRRLLWIVPVVALGTTTLTAATEPAKAGTKRPAAPVRVSVGINGEQPNAGSERLSISGDGRYVVFTSRATNLVRGVADGLSHVYLRDLRCRTTVLVDVNSAGRRGDGHSWDASISADGRFVAFMSEAPNFARGAPDGLSHAYVRDLRRDTTTLVDVNNAGQKADKDTIQPRISPSGGAVVFMSHASNLATGDVGDTWNVYLRNLQTRTTTLVNTGLGGSAANGLSYGPSVDASHRFVSFASLASNLVPGDTNKMGDVFLRDLKTRKTTRVSIGNDGAQGDDLTVGSSISANGQYVAFSSHATNLAPGLPTDHSSHSYLRDLRADKTILVDVNRDGVVANAPSTWTSVSADGRYAYFQSSGTNLAANKTNKTWDVFRRDLKTNETVLVSSSDGGAQTDGENWWPAASADNRVIGFLSFASDVMPGDTNGASDVYVWRR